MEMLMELTTSPLAIISYLTTIWGSVAIMLAADYKIKRLYESE